MESTLVTKKRSLLHYLLLPLRVIYKIHIFLMFVLSLLLFYPVLYLFLKDAKRLKTAFWIIKVYTHVFHNFALIPPRVKGAANFPATGPYLACFNHGSFIDITNAYNVMPRYFIFVGKKELKKWPLFQVFFLSEMNILIDRQSKIGSYRALMKIAEEIDKGNPVALFPEGTMTKKSPEMNDFKPGAFVVAIQKQVPIVPVTYVTHWRRIENGGFWHGFVSPGFCEVIVHEPVYTKGLGKADEDALAKKVHDIIYAPIKKRYKIN